MAMRQLTCTGPRTLEWHEVAEPSIVSPGDAVVRPLAVARCDIDPLLIAGLLPQRGPFALGHEAVVEIVAVGEDVRTRRPGERAVVSFQLSCGSCGRCRVGHSASCEGYPLLSDFGMQPLSGVEYGGMLSELVRVPHADAMLEPVPAGCAPTALASVSDNVLDGYRSVAPHLAARPGSSVLFVCHGPARSIPLYGIQAALALDASRVDFASDDPATLALAEKLGARPIETDFGRRGERYPIVVDAGVRAEGLRYALTSTEPQGICQSVSFYAGAAMEIPLGRLYTLGIELHTGRANAAALLPEVMRLIAAGRLHPDRVTTRIARWEEAPEAFLEDSIKLVVARDVP